MDCWTVIEEIVINSSSSVPVSWKSALESYIWIDRSSDLIEQVKVFISFESFLLVIDSISFREETYVYHKK